MRWSYILPRAILLGLVWAFFSFGFDPLLRGGLIYSGQRSARAKVEIAELSTTFFAPSLKANNVQVANRKHPGTNLVEFTDLHAKVETRPLLRKSFIVEEASLSGLRWDTKRADSGLLPGDKPDLSEGSDSQVLDKVKQEMLARGRDWLAGLLDRAKLDLDPQQFETVRLGHELEERWPKEFGRYDDEINALKQRIDELRNAVKIKTGNELEKADRYARAAQDAERLLHEIEQLKGKFGQSMRQAQDDMHAMNEAKDHDLMKIKEKADILHLDPNEITEFLLGPELTNRLETAIGWVKFLRERIQLATDEPKPERIRGENILFKRKEELPLLLIRLLNVDGEGDFNGEQLAFKGTISGVTTDPKIHGKPIIVRIDGAGVGADAGVSGMALATGKSSRFAASPAASAVPLTKDSALNVQLKAVLDFTKEVPEHQFLLSYKEPRPDERELGNSDSVKLAVASKGLDCLADLKLVGDDLSGRINFRQALESITAKPGDKRFKGDDRVLEVVQDVVSGIRKIEAEMNLSGTALKPRFKLQSNLGHELSDGINTAFARQLEAGRRDLLVRFNQETSQRSAKLTQLYEEQIQKLTGKLQLNKGAVQEIAQSFGLKFPGNLDLKRIASGLPDGLKSPFDPSKPIDLKSLSNNLPKLNPKLPKFDEQPEQQSPTNNQPTKSPIQQASEIEQGLDSLFRKKKPRVPAPKTVKPALEEKPATK